MDRTPYDPPAIIKPADALAELAGQINAEHQQAESALRTGLEHARRAGELLLQAKQQCRHGEWLPWLEANAHFTVRTAQGYMRVARRWLEIEAKAKHVSHLSYRDGLNLLVETGEGAEKATANPQDANEPPSVHLPELRPGCSYICDGHSLRFGKCWAEIDPHSDHPGYWAYAFYFGIEEPWAFVEYCGRGIRLDHNNLAKIMANNGFIPSEPWQETKPDALQRAVQWRKEDFRRELVGFSRRG
jgi:hypothetical protein